MQRAYSAQQRRCALCGGAMLIDVDRNSPKHLSIDHVYPKSILAGGLAAPPKLLFLAHRDCNTAKRDRQPRACEILFAIVVMEIAA